jgi:hypothetical protein
MSFRAMVQRIERDWSAYETSTDVTLRFLDDPTFATPVMSVVWISAAEPAPNIGDSISAGYAPTKSWPVAEVEARCAEAHRRELDYATWAASLVTVLVCLGQLAAERAPPSRESWIKNVEVD